MLGEGFEPSNCPLCHPNLSTALKVNKKAPLNTEFLQYLKGPFKDVTTLLRLLFISSKIPPKREFETIKNNPYFSSSPFPTNSSAFTGAPAPILSIGGLSRVIHFLRFAASCINRAVSGVTLKNYFTASKPF